MSRKNNQFRLVTKNYFEGLFYVIGWILIVLSLFLFFLAWYIGLIGAFLGYLIVSTSYCLDIDPSAKTIEDYLFVLGTKKQKEVISYEKLDCIFITASKYNQQLNHQSISTSVRGVLFKAFLKTDNDKHYLGESRDLRFLDSKVKPLAEKFGLEIKTP